MSVEYPFEVSLGDVIVFEQHFPVQLCIDHGDKIGSIIGVGLQDHLEVDSIPDDADILRVRVSFEYTKIMGEES